MSVNGSPLNQACSKWPACVYTWTALTAKGFHLLATGDSKDLAQWPAMIEHLCLHPSTRINPHLTVALCEPNEQGAP